MSATRHICQCCCPAWPEVCCTEAVSCSRTGQQEGRSASTPAAAARLARSGTFTDSPMCSGCTRLSLGDAPGDSRLLLDAGDPGDCRPVCLPAPSTSCKQRAKLAVCQLRMGPSWCLWCTLWPWRQAQLAMSCGNSDLLLSLPMHVCLRCSCDRPLA